jgi:hypothetical protein
MNMVTKARDFWTQSVPMTFDDQPKSYEEKRRFRYELQDYMHEEFQFSTFAGKKALEAGGEIWLRWRNDLRRIGPRSQYFMHIRTILNL